MPLPRGDEYLVAVQNPGTAFADSALRGCRPETDRFGIPRPYSGGFTTTFHLLNCTREWAARCFTRPVPDLQERYAAIDGFLSRNPDGLFVGTEYLAQGVRVTGQWHPVIKMQWVQGEPLSAFVDRHVGNAEAMRALIREFQDLLGRLQRLGVAHGDLQHGNILVMNDRLYLIDYDGMFVPGLAHLRTNELGHVNYQHPGRNATHHGPYLDRFASIVIYLGLSAVLEKPALWARYDNSENILFRGSDFQDPGASPLLREMGACPSLAQLVDRFRGVCKLDFRSVPDLSTFLAGNFTYPKVAVSTVVARKAAPVLGRRERVAPGGPDQPSARGLPGQRIGVMGLMVDYYLPRTSTAFAFARASAGSSP